MRRGGCFDAAWGCEGAETATELLLCNLICFLEKLMDCAAADRASMCNYHELNLSAIESKVDAKIIQYVRSHGERKRTGAREGGGRGEMLRT